MILAGDIKKNVCLRIDGRIYVVIDFLHVKPGKGNTVMRTKLRDVADTGVDIISIGALTHTIKSADISLKFSIS